MHRRHVDHHTHRTGAYSPHADSTASAHVARNSVDLPAMLGPVKMKRLSIEKLLTVVEADPAGSQ